MGVALHVLRIYYAGHEHRIKSATAQASSEPSLTRSNYRTGIGRSIGGTAKSFDCSFRGDRGIYCDNRWTQPLPDHLSYSYDGTQYGGPDIQPVTPNDAFHVVTKNNIDPNPIEVRSRLEIADAMERPLSYRFSELITLPANA